MKAHYAAALVIIVVAVGTVLVLGLNQPVVPDENNTQKPDTPAVRLGISHYDLSNVTVNGATRLAAARLMNSGTLDLNIVVLWTQKNGALLNADVEPASFLLKADDSVKVYLSVNPEEPGTYEGVIEIQGFRATSEGGNQVVSGGSVDAKITAV